ncbi:hypothetical protein FHU28_005563 [Micromonospora echinospora]|uniref:PPE family protein n=2 Tax=Micromonospora echinospora TaxID=1877 RepID=A0ABR6MK19_MICEC|nr:hypothetical protein [Micromonospora echinospora]MBB5115724.1 hypothetical protein [Micromonospora echinospora]
MAGGTWERCVREVTLSADPETVGSVGAGWRNLSTALGHLRDSLVGRSFVGPIAAGQERPHTGGLPGLLAGWQGSGGDAYREHLGEIGKEIEELITHASNVSGALSRIEGDIRTAVASIPIPLMDNFGWNEWSLPGGTELDDARDGESQSGFLAALRSDYQSNQALYADGAFRDKADDLEATMKVDGNANDQKRGGWWDTKSHLDNWYRDNQQAANRAMSPLPAAVEAERPKLVVPQPDGRLDDGYRADPRVPPSGVPGGGLPGGGGGGAGGGGGMPSLGSTGIGGGGAGVPGGGSFTPPPTTGVPGTGGGPGGGSYTPPGIGVPGAGAPGSGSPEYGTGLAGAGGPGTITPGGPGSTFGSGGAGLSTGGAGFGGGGGGAGLGSAGGIGGGGLGAAGGMGMGALPGMVGGGNGKVPPLTSAAGALRAAAGAGPGGAGARGGLAGAGMAGGGMMGGGMMGGHGGAGHGGGGGDHSSWLTEDDDPWGTGDGASPGILR